MNTSALTTFTATAHSFGPDELFIQRLDALETNGRQILTKDTFFAGGDVLTSYAGTYRFSFLGGKRVIDLRPNTALVIYPGNTVTIEAPKGTGRLKYAIFGGSRVADFFDGYGFYDRLVLTGDTQEAIFDLAMRESATNQLRALGYLQDALATLGRQLQTGPEKRLHAILRTIDRELRDGRATVKTVCAELNISRATLNRTFDEADMGSPRDYIQARIAMRAAQLLIATETPIADVAREVGIDSPAYFTEFIRRQLGQTPRELRSKGLR